MRLASLFLLTSLAAACYDGGPSAGDTDASSDASGPSGPSTAPGTDGPASTTDDPEPGSTGTTGEPDPDSTGDESTGEPMSDPAIHWVGRHDASDPNVVRMSWSGSGLVVRFDGTGATVDMDDPAGFFTVVVDGAEQPRLQTTPGLQSYPVAAGLPPGEHTVELYRRTEASFGPTVVHQVTLDGELLAPPPVTRRMEVVGDSITCGYGNEGNDPCNFSADTENHYLTYGAVAARTVGAELHTIAWSGKGVVYNYGDDMFQPLPELYDRTIGSERPAWGFGWQPDVVVINLGTNDFSTDNDPPQGLFVDSYVAFLAHVREVNPGAFILIVAPVLFGGEADMVQGYLEDVVAQRQAAGDADVAFADINVQWTGSGCNGHPSVPTHADMAAALVEQLQLHLGW